MRLLLENGVVLEGATPRELVVQLKLDMLTPEPTIEDYYKGVRGRCRIWDGTEMEFVTDFEFLKELDRKGLVVLEE